MADREKQFGLASGDLDSFVSLLREALAVPRNERDLDLARRLCTYSRYTHSSVWQVCPPRAYVKEDIIPLLFESQNAILDTLNATTSPREEERLKVYARNIDLRLDNLEKYVRGVPSDFAPDHKVAEIEEKYSISDGHKPRRRARRATKKGTKGSAKKSTGKADARVRDLVFISYSHSETDEQWLLRLRKQLGPLVRRNSINLWLDDKIGTGTRWEKEILRAIGRAKVAVLLVSPDYLDSDFIYEKELPAIIVAAESGELKIIPIHLSASMYHKTDLNDYQAAHSPAHPLDRLSPGEQNEVLVRICQEIDSAANS